MRRLIFGAVVVKLLLMPLVGIPLIYAAVHARLLPADEPMLLVIIMIQTGVPSAQTSLALMVAAGLQKEAGELSLVYLPMYICSIFTMAAVILVSTLLIQDLQGLVLPGEALNLTATALLNLTS